MKKSFILSFLLIFCLSVFTSKNIAAQDYNDYNDPVKKYPLFDFVDPDLNQTAIEGEFFLSLDYGQLDGYEGPVICRSSDFGNLLTCYRPDHTPDIVVDPKDVFTATVIPSTSLSGIANTILSVAQSEATCLNGETCPNGGTVSASGPIRKHTIKIVDIWGANAKFMLQLLNDREAVKKTLEAEMQKIEKLKTLLAPLKSERQRSKLISVGLDITLKETIKIHVKMRREEKQHQVKYLQQEQVKRIV